MTKPNPSAWGDCPFCDGRYRTSNKYGMCGKCAHRVLNAQRLAQYRKADRIKEDIQPEPMPAVVRQAREVASVALWVAREDGHEIDSMLQDSEPAAWIGQCLRCAGYLCVDLADSQDPYGRASEGECPGTPPVPASKRLDPDKLDYSVRSAGHEPAMYQHLGWPGEEDD